MTMKEPGEMEDKDLLDRYRRASNSESSAPSDATRAAILAEGRRVAAEMRKTATHNFDPSRPAANDSRWKITAFGTVGAALLAALLIAPRYWNTSPLRKESAAVPSAAISESASPASKDSSLSNTPAAAAPPAPPAPAPAPQAPMANAIVSSKAELKSAPSRDAASREAASAYAGAETADRMFKRAQSPATLQSAAKSGDLLQATALLDQGVAIESRDQDGRTALMLAVAQNRLEVVRLLLRRGADPNAADNSGRTPLQVAADQKLGKIVELLRGAGAR